MFHLTASVEELLALARSAARLGFAEHADLHLGHAARHASGKGALLAAVAEAAVDIAGHGPARRFAADAERVAERAHTLNARTKTLLTLARVAHRVGEHDRARDLIARCEAAAAEAGDERVLAAAARAAHDIGRTWDALRLLAAAERTARAIDRPGRRDWALVAVAEAAVAVGDHQRVAAVADDMQNTTQLVAALLALARCDEPKWRDLALARVLQISRWFLCADDLVRAGSGVLDAIVEELGAVSRSRGPDTATGW